MVTQETKVTDIAVMTIENVRAYLDKEGTVWLNAEDVARGLGFTENKNGVEYVMWRRVNQYLKDFGFFDSSAENSAEVGKADFIPENMFYRLAMKAKNETAEKFQAKVADDILPTIRKTGMYTTKNMSTWDILEMAIKNARENERRLKQQEQKISNVNAKLNDAMHTSAHNDFVLQCTDKMQQVQIDRNTQDIKDIQEVVFITSPRESLNTFVKDAVIRFKDEENPPTYQTVYTQIYNDLRKATGVNLSLRLTKLKQRLESQGASKTKIKNTSILDVIDQDPALWEPLKDIMQDYREKYEF